MNAVKGSFIAILSSLISAVIFAYLFRLPIPLAGTIGPFGDFSSYDADVSEVLTSVALAWVFYGAFGGFIVIPLFGAMAGYVAGKRKSSPEHKNRDIALWSILAGGVPVLFISTLDYLIGPW